MLFTCHILISLKRHKSQELLLTSKPLVELKKNAHECLDGLLYAELREKKKWLKRNKENKEGGENKDTYTKIK